jgi:hypothetical protein
MPIWDLFSKREAQKRKQGQEDVFQYDDLPAAFRVQVIHLWVDALGIWQQPSFGTSARQYLPNRLWAQIHDGVAREKGVFRLGREHLNPFDQCQEYIQQTNTENALDLIEASFRVVHTIVRHTVEYERQQWGIRHPDETIKELNGRFREHRIGYEFSGGKIIRVDSKFLHAEAVKPALQLLYDGGKAFSGPLQEFLSAHEHYRKGEMKEALVDALKAFESTLKTICTLRKWPFNPHKDTASKLLQIVFDQELIPDWMQSQYTSLKAILESGVPTVRNKLAGHGQGSVPIAVPGHFVSYALNLTAANLVFLIEAHKAKS